MYFQKDYVLRMIEMMGDLIRRICSIAREAEAVTELDEIANRACGLPMRILATADPETLRTTLSEAQCFLAAELLLIEAQVKGRKLDEETILPLRVQALSLFASLRDADYVLPAADRTATLVAEHLGTLPAHVLITSADLLERGGQYARAEDAIFAAIDQDKRYIEDGVLFYQRIEKVDNQHLRLGGLPRDEIAEGYAALAERLCHYGGPLGHHDGPVAHNA